MYIYILYLYFWIEFWILENYDLRFLVYNLLIVIINKCIKCLKYLRLEIIKIKL